MIMRQYVVILSDSQSDEYNLSLGRIDDFDNIVVDQRSIVLLRCLFETVIQSSTVILENVRIK
jgi:hypothetical protein